MAVAVPVVVTVAVAVGVVAMVVAVAVVAVTMLGVHVSCRVRSARDTWTFIWTSFKCKFDGHAL